MIKVKGFLLFEACLGLLISCMGIMLLSITLGEGKKIQNNMEKRVDQAMANYILKNKKENQIIIHNKTYSRLQK